MEVALDLGNGQRLDSFQVRARKSLHTLEGPIRRNVDVKGDCAEAEEGKESGRERVYQLRENIHHRAQNVGGNMNVKAGSGEISEMRNMLLESGGKAVLE